MGQAWMEKPEEKFRPGVVRVGWRESTLCIFAKLEDDRIFTRATGDNQRLWVRGDVFEIFLRDTKREEYLELHIAPNGHRLQLRFPDDQTIEHLRNGHVELEDYMVDQPLFDFFVRTVTGGWEVWAQIPVVSLGSSSGSANGMCLLASFSRYDYEDEKSPPVHSSTSAHPKLSFHRQQEWKKLTFTE